jgi:hypothetical protein
MNNGSQEQGGAQQVSGAASLISGALSGLMPQSALGDFVKQAQEISGNPSNVQPANDPNGNAGAGNSGGNEGSNGAGTENQGGNPDENGNAGAAGDDSKKGDDNNGNQSDKGLSFLNKKSQEPAKEVVSDIPELLSTPEAVQFIEKKYGIKEPKKFFESVEKWRNSSQDLSKVSDQVNRYNKLFDQLPEPIFAAIESFLKNEDWTKPITARPLSVDFSKEAKDIDAKTLLGIYNPNEFSEEDFEIASQDPTSPQAKAIKFAHENAVRSYNEQKDFFKNKRANENKLAVEYRQRVESSAVSSVDKLKQVLPETAEPVLKEIESSLVSGNFDSYFRNSDGSLNDNAAKFMLFIKYGDEIVNMIVNKEVVKSANAAKAEVIVRTPEKVATAIENGNGNTKGGQDAVKDYINKVLPPNTSSTY